MFSIHILNQLQMHESLLQRIFGDLDGFTFRSTDYQCIHLGRLLFGTSSVGTLISVSAAGGIDVPCLLTKSTWSGGIVDNQPLMDKLWVRLYGF